MTPRRLASLVPALLLACLAQPAAANAPPALLPPSPGLECRQAIAQAERGSQLPPHLLAAIARVESGRRNPLSGSVDPWPWSINVEGQDYVYDTEPQVLAAVRGFQASGVRSIDVGCMQINLMHHPDAFTSLEQAFDPQANAAYAVKFLTQLRDKTGSWDKATAWYHSATPELGDDYLRKVSAALPEEGKITTEVPNIGMSRFPVGGAGMIMPMHASMARIIPMPGLGGGAAVGRSLDSYRSFPVVMASRR